MHDLALVRRDHWTFRFVVMLTLSVIVAAMGLSAGSAAVVIGAMLLAPLMSPVLGLAAAVAMGLFRKIGQSILRVGLATAWCIAITWLISAVLPDGPLSSEVLARTSPDLRDLVVAFAAGLAGAYATVREDVSASLPGVAVAVALVPPLAAVGVALEAGRTDLAGGALLLYGTNLAAIVLAGVGVFITTGFVPPRRLVHATPGVVAGSIAAAAVVVAVTIPLMQASVAAARTAQRQSAVDQAVGVWLSGRDEIVVDAVHVDDGRVTVEVSGPERPPDQEQLEALLAGLLGPDVRASVLWTRSEQVTTTTAPATTTTTVSLAQQREDAVRDAVDTWLEQAGRDQGTSFELDALLLTEDGRVRIDVIGVGQAPDVEALTAHLISEFGDDLSVTLTWIPRSVVVPEPPEPADTNEPSTELVAAITAYARSHAVDVAGIDLDDGILRIDLVGEEVPEEIETLEAVIADMATEETDVEIYFTPRVRLDHVGEEPTDG